MLHIEDLNESFVKLNCDPHLIKELQEKFSFQVPGYKFNPKFKAGLWDGKIRLVNSLNYTIYKGLVPDVIDYCKGSNYNVTIDQSFKRYREEIEFDWESLQLPFEPRDFQKTAVDVCLRKKRQLILSSTGSGKSLIIYAMINAMLKAGKRTMLIVPQISLVNQMLGDFVDYSVNDPTFDADELCHLVYSGKEKVSKKPVYITTWQSVQRLPKKFFQQFDCMIADEVHTFQAKACSSIMEKAEFAFYRYGFTGTLNDSKTHEMMLKALFGPITQVSKTKDLMDQGILTPIDIRAIILKYSNEESTPVRKLKYKDEVSYITEHPKRNKFITKLTGNCKGNTLVLFRFVKKHGKPLFDLMKDELNNKQVYFIHGGTDSDQRENIRRILESNSNVVVIASDGVFSTGVSVNNLHNIISTHPSKAKIKLLQSIGRGLRLHESKEKCLWYDIADDFRGKTKTPNHTLKHFQERYKIYVDQEFDVQMTQLEF